MSHTYLTVEQSSEYLDKLRAMSKLELASELIVQTLFQRRVEVVVSEVVSSGYPFCGRCGQKESDCSCLRRDYGEETTVSEKVSLVIQALIEKADRSEKQAADSLAMPVVMEELKKVCNKRREEHLDQSNREDRKDTRRRSLPRPEEDE